MSHGARMCVSVERAAETGESEVGAGGDEQGDLSRPIPLRAFEEGASRRVDAHRNIVRAARVRMVGSDDASISGSDLLHRDASMQPEGLAAALISSGAPSR